MYFLTPATPKAPDGSGTDLVSKKERGRARNHQLRNFSIFKERETEGRKRTSEYILDSST